MNELKNRKIISSITKFLSDHEIIILHGSRQVGKTSILKILMSGILKEKTPRSNIIYFDLEDFDLVELCNSGPDKVVEYLKGINCDFKNKIYLIIDEIQYLENPSSFLKLFHDRYRETIKIIVSGSSSFEIKSKFKDSLVGRSLSFEIFTLDFEEFLLFKGEKVNLEGKLPDFLNKKLLGLYKEYVLYGSYPAIVLEDSIEKKEFKLKQIINTYIRKDVRDLFDIRDINKFNSLIRILAGQSAKLLNIYELSNTIKIARQTIEEYILILENTYIVKRIYPFHKNIRSELTKMPKIYFEDTGVLNILNNRTFSEIVSGELFENSVYMNLRRSIPVEYIYFWRTNRGQEVDFILDKGKIVPIEVKLSYRNKLMKNSLYFIDKYNTGGIYCITLEKSDSSKYGSIYQLYPWEIYKVFL